MKTAHLQSRGQRWFVVRVIGAGLLAATGAIHLDLYLTGYRTIPTIGWLFLLQVVAAFSLGAIVLATGSRLVSAMGAAFALSTLGGYFLSLQIGLFGFREVRTEVGIVAGIIEVLAFAALASYALPADRYRSSGLVIATVSVLSAVLLGVAAASAVPISARSSHSLLRIARIHGVRVLTNSNGFTLYWFAPDSPKKSACYGTCAAYWPPVTGRPTAGPGVTGELSTIPRSGGQIQATYEGHPLYTYVGDSAPGQATGNDINLNGGLWHEMDASS
jgi:predicted lipoprotein with Yx(FWY)xxD motif